MALTVKKRPRSPNRRDAKGRASRPKAAGPRTPPSKVPPQLQKEAPPAISDIPAATPKDPELMKNMCYGCKQNCCGLRVDITPFDIARIVHLEGKVPLDFISLAVAKDDDALAFRLNGKHVKLVLKTANGSCVFARNGSLRCSIEKAKPAVCIVYPFSIQDGVPYIRADILCPWGNQMRADRSKMSAEILESWEYEYSRFQDTLDFWNSYAKGNETFEQFMRFVASDIDADRNPISALARTAHRLRFRAGFR